MELATIAARANITPSPYVTGGAGAEAMLEEIDDNDLGGDEELS